MVENNELITCQIVLNELQRVLRTKFRISPSLVDSYVALLKSEAIVAPPAKPLTVKIKDPDDAPILACAVACAADFFVTGDKALVEYQSIAGMPIVDPRRMWTRLAGLT